MADHELSAKDAIFEAHFAVKSGEAIVTGIVQICMLFEVMKRRY